MAGWMDNVAAGREDAPRGPTFGPAYRPGAKTGAGGKVSAKYRHEVFTIFRPWQACARCQKAVALKPEILPEEGDYVCPHTRMKEYLEVAQKISDGETHRHVSATEGRSETGDVSVSMVWLEEQRSPVRDPEVDGPQPPEKPPLPPLPPRGGTKV